MTSRVSMLLKSRASPDMLLPASVTRKTCNSSHEQTPLSNDTIDSALQHREVIRPKDLSAPSRIVAKSEKGSVTYVHLTLRKITLFLIDNKRGAVTLKYLVSYFVGDTHHTMDKLEANTTLWFIKPQDIYLMTR